MGYIYISAILMRRIYYNKLCPVRERWRKKVKILRIQNEMGLTCVSNWPAVQTRNLHEEEKFQISPPLLFHAKW